MKSLFLASAAIAAFAAAPAFAQTAPSGSVGLTWNQVEADAGSNFEADTYTFDGVVAGPTFGEWTVTLGGNMSWVDGSIDDDKAFSGQVHVTRDFNGLRAGAFAGAADAAGETLLTAGAEVQKYFDKATVTGVVSYGSIDDLDADIWSVGVNAGYYVLPSLRVNAAAGFSAIDISGFDTDAYNYGVGAEYEIAGTPMSVYGGWDRTTLNDADLDVDTFAVGLRFNFGGTLQQRERSGADLTRSLGGVTGVLGGINAPI